MLGIMYALAKFQPYLVGNRFKAKTDHNSLWYFLDWKRLNERKHKLVSKVHSYDFDIEYVKGKNNSVVDDLSGRPIILFLMDIVEDYNSHILVEYSKNQSNCEILDG